MYFKGFAGIVRKSGKGSHSKTMCSIVFSLTKMMTKMQSYSKASIRGNASQTAVHSYFHNSRLPSLDAIILDVYGEPYGAVRSSSFPAKVFPPCLNKLTVDFQRRGGA